MKVHICRLVIHIATVIILILKTNISIAEFDQSVIIKPYTVGTTDFHEEYKGVGQVKFVESQYITAKASSTVEYVTAMQGQSVKKGEVIISLNKKKARQALAKAQVEMESAESTLKRDISLHKKKIISDEILDKSKVQLERTKLEVVTAKENLEDLIASAPFDGVIGVIKPRIGDEVKIGDKLFTIVTPSKKEVIVELPQTLIGKINHNTLIYATDINGNKVYGTISAMSSYLSASGTLSTKIEFDQTAYFIHDSFVEVSFEYNQHSAKSIPEKAVLKNDKGYFIYKITDENKVKQLYIETGIRTNENIEVLSEDLKVGDKIILEGLTKVYEGITITIPTEKKI